MPLYLSGVEIAALFSQGYNHIFCASGKKAGCLFLNGLRSLHLNFQFLFIGNKVGDLFQNLMRNHPLNSGPFMDNLDPCCSDAVFQGYILSIMTNRCRYLFAQQKPMYCGFPRHIAALVYLPGQNP